MSLILSNIFKSERRQFFLHNLLPKLYFIDLFVTCLHVDELLSRRHAGKLYYDVFIHIFVRNAFDRDAIYVSYGSGTNCTGGTNV